MKNITLFTLLMANFATAADQATIRAELQPVQTRKPASEFALRDAAAKTATLAAYRGKVVLLDFWATWCTGCKQEIPLFVDFQKRYRKTGLAVIGVSLDDEGWKVLNPFLAEHPIGYRIALGDDAMAKRFGIEGMPDTFLIDKQGLVAAAYRAGIVDKDDMEANIRALLASDEVRGLWSFFLLQETSSILSVGKYSSATARG